METHLELEHAKLAAQQGNKQLARSILRRILRREPENEFAWLLFAEVVERREETIAWLQHVLEINPNNTLAREKLAVYLDPVSSQTNSEPRLTQSNESPRHRAVPSQPIASSAVSSPLKSPSRVFGCILLTVLVLACCLTMASAPELYVYVTWQAGVASYNDGNCREAITRFQQVLDNPGWGIVNAEPQARQLRQECLDFLKAVDNEDNQDFGFAIAHYVDFLQSHPTSGLASYALSRITALFDQKRSEELATEELCNQLTLLKQSELLQRPNEQLPELHYYCGRTYEKAGKFKEAKVMYSAVRIVYSQHRLAPEATEGLARVDIEFAWGEGITAFNAGDCTAANTRFRQIRDNPDWKSVKAIYPANLLFFECLAFLKAIVEEDAGHFGLALAYYVDFHKTYSASGLYNYLPSKVTTLLTKASWEELAVEPLCDWALPLKESKLLPQPDEQLPELYYYCGHTYEKIGEPENAITMYNTVRIDYSNHPLSPAATEDLARVEIELAQASNARPFPQPEQSGTAPEGVSVYVVQNDSPEAIQIILRGPETVIKEIPACDTCQKLTKEPDQCPNKGPVELITLKPGRYTVLVKSIGESTVTPYKGAWNFESGGEYTECYYILTNPKP